MDDSISIKELLGIVLKRWMLIGMLTIGVATILAIPSYYLLTPKYEASTQILVNQNNLNFQLDASQMRSNIEVISTYREIIKSPAILEKVIENLELNVSFEELNRNITVNSQSQSQVFTVKVIDPSPEKAVQIANNIAATFQHDIKNIMNVDNVNILAKAQLKETPVPISPNPIMNIAVGIVFGFIMGVVLALLLEYLDNTIKSIEDVEEYLQLPVLSSIQKISKQKVNKDTSIQRMEVEIVETQLKV